MGDQLDRRSIIFSSMPSLHLSRTRRWLLSSPPVEWGVRQLRELLIGALRRGPIPRHVAFVMDGNRRFARHHDIETVEGHNLGFEALAKILEVCYKSGVKVVTIYAFSIENFKRSKYEVDALMDMAKVKLSQLSQHGDLLDRYGARIRILGQRNLVKPDVLEAIDRAVELTSRNGKAILNVCFPYTSRNEITNAICETVAEYATPLPEPQRPFSESHISHNIRSRHLGQGSAPPTPFLGISTTSDADDSASSSSTLYVDSPSGAPTQEPVRRTYPDPESITPETIDRHLYTAGNPPLDLLIRTSGVERLSDFMLWQCHQDTEIVFLDCLWPEFGLWNFLPVLLEWQWRDSFRMQKQSANKTGSSSILPPFAMKADPWVRLW
ncbi:MAG: cis-prenyltransferase [Peltula sp. TS41687]|nr:MAG: cis-prenyltransferase [Peltula sp. TS41687]